MELQAIISLARETIKQPIAPNSNYTTPKAPCLPHVFTRMCQPVSFRKQSLKFNLLSVFLSMSSFVLFSAN